MQIRDGTGLKFLGFELHQALRFKLGKVKQAFDSGLALGVSIRN